MSWRKSLLRLWIVVILGVSQIGLTLAADTLAFPKQIDVSADTVKPGKIYESSGVKYMVEKVGDNLQFSQFRSATDDLLTGFRNTVSYDSSGNFLQGSDTQGQPVSPDSLAEPSSSPIGNPSHPDAAAVAGSAKDAPKPPEGGGAVEVIVTEKIPGANCTPYGTGTGVTGKKYKCTVEKGFWSVRSMLAGLIKYATFLTGLIGVLMIVFSGLQYATSAGDTDAQKKSISRITKLVGWLVLLMLTALILNTIAPWIYG